MLLCVVAGRIAAFPVGDDDRVTVGYGDAFQDAFSPVSNPVAVAVEKERSRTHWLCPALLGCHDKALCQKCQYQVKRNRFHG